MRSRSNSGIQLDFYHRIICQTVIKHQNSITGLVAYSAENSDAWVRDNVYCACGLWALALAYRKAADIDNDRAKAYELEQSVVKLMRGLLVCMMRQADKVETFKHSQVPKNSLHAKYSSEDHSTVVSDSAWGHLQIDATSFYLLMLAQMTASGLQIIYTLDEVDFIQNLVYYIESAYRIPDYGIWERGDKTNHGLPELNSSSIGMAKAAMEAIAGLDMFGSNGSCLSTIQVQADKVAQCSAILQSLLPRESNSKEVDSGLLSIIGFPAFAVDNQDLVNLTREAILNKCLGRYGCCRFLRDGYKTALEDPNRLHYEPGELQRFENVECEWPLFLAYLSINETFSGNKDAASDYMTKLNKLQVKMSGGLRVLPEMYAVPADQVQKERKEAGSQLRVAVGQIPHKWSQSLYVISCLLSEGFISPSELDPLNRRLNVLPKPDLVVQLVILAETEAIRACLEKCNIKCHTIESFQNGGRYKLHPAKVLAETFHHLGKNSRFRLTGRPGGVGLLATSTLYRYGEGIHCFIPELYNHQSFYLAMDQDFIFDNILTDLQYLKANWQLLGRPTMILPIYTWMSDFSGEVPFEFRSSISKMQSGYYGGVRVQLGNMDNFLSTSCVESLEWLHFKTDSKACQLFTSPQHTSLRSRLSSGASEFSNRKSELRDTAPSVHGIIRRGLSVLLTDPDVDFTASVSHPRADNSLNVSRSVTGMLKVNSCSQFPANLPGQSSTFSKQNSMELVDLLLNTDEATEQADIIHYLFITHGPDYQIKLDADSDTSCSVADLLEELYQKSGSLKMWWLVRYSAAMLRKKVHYLASALSDLLVRQKQVTFGLPAHKECVVTQPISHDEIVEKIEQVCNIGSESTDQDISDYLPNSPHCMLHQELLLYMSMYVRTEPRLFHEMLRVRIGLVIAVMTKELSHCLNCSEEEATSHLLNLSPYELKNFLYHILSAKDFVVLEVEEPQAAVSDTGRVKSRTSSTKHRIFRPALISNSNMCKDLLSTADAEDVCEDSLGQWSRHRRIDGALNRVPVGFYSKIWHVLKQCGGLSVDGTILPHSLVKEMTEGELKFALRVESVLNNITEPEYRQLVVEALCALNIFSQMSRDGRFIPSTISVDDIVHKAYLLFLQDHGMEAGSNHLTTSDGRSKHSCHRLRGICEAFYDSAPSGPYGTIPYMCKAALQVIPLATKQDSDTIECLIQ